jgi:hypothetical protein
MANNRSHLPVLLEVVEGLAVVARPSRRHVGAGG